MSRDRLVGRRLPTYTFVVEAGKVAEFAAAVLADDPVHFDAGAAAETGYDGVVAPPTFSAAAQSWGRPAGDGGLELDLRRVLAGGAEWEYRAPIVAGDTLTVTGEIVSVERKSGRRGGMTLITRENRFVNQRDDLALVVRSTLIELDDAPADKGDEA
ncbi:FAS1-like dehydratase domain-containing protein [Kribbella solani]|uniref:Acyl dehydratase n=1 Tax=Kribbella solani TaxID=236067 RepID=A0A841DKY0_9ACTN|nr:MaoC family dehydratase N-terminal domain-containing protein [Kribbella solani]MBB5977330.1 acyl dehydratase [Kribbella solani]MDX2972663.1 MaoC family dehydratase N-terminal domain-containing protein [Kribbella solani]MDX3001658.1 MaoC family dehydratase N-terminal domain-containing protein [Kribbella solani]